MTDQRARITSRVADRRGGRFARLAEDAFDV
ncbi:hypothetical protein J2754_001369 [Halarchaeum solikamskense]|nr:hypothetical protein [Halarchaeum solikamskense]